MKFFYLLPAFCLAVFFISFLTNCSKSNQSIDRDITTQFLNVIYSEGTHCCRNLRAIESFDLPANCEGPFPILFATNIDDFSDLNLSSGDTLFIEFNFGDDCEAATAAYNCITYCDIRHGVPIEILAIE